MGFVWCGQGRWRPKPRWLVVLDEGAGSSHSLVRAVYCVFAALSTCALPPQACIVVLFPCISFLFPVSMGLACAARQPRGKLHRGAQRQSWAWVEGTRWVICSSHGCSHRKPHSWAGASGHRGWLTLAGPAG